MSTRRFNTALSSLLIAVVWTGICEGQQQRFQTPVQYSILERTGASATTPDSVDASEKINQIVTRLALDAIPHNYTRDKDWGGQERRWDGIEWRRENGRLETKRKWKMVNHGTWKKYSATLIDPAQHFSIEIKNFHQAANQHLAFDVHFASHLRFDARQAKWVKGVQLYSVSAEGHGKVRLVVSCELAVDMDITKFPPHLIYRPTVKSADLIVDEFRIDRVSKLGGEFAQQVSRAVRKDLDEKIAEKELKLVQKINKQLDENQDDFRLSVSDSLKQKWAAEVKELLPAEVQEAFESSDR